MSFEQGPGDPVSSTGQPSEEELRAAYEAELKQIKVEHVLIEQVVTLVNLGMRRTGLAPGTEDERDIEQVRLAIDAVRALLPLLEQTAAPQAGQIREALTQLQFAFVKLGGAPQPAAPGTPADAGPPRAGTPRPGAPGPGAAEPAPASPSGADPTKPEEGGPAQRSGRLWIPGQ